MSSLGDRERSLASNAQPGNILGNSCFGVEPDRELPRIAAIEKLSDKAVKAAIRTAVVSGKPSRLADGGGLYVEARPTGIGWWRFRFWADGKEGMLSLGTYPDVSLAMARERRAESRRAMAEGTHPSEHRKAAKVAIAARQEVERMVAAGLPMPGTFEHSARDWYARHLGTWSPGHATKMLALMVNDMFPYLGRRPLAELNAPEVLAAVHDASTCPQS